MPELVVGGHVVARQLKNEAVRCVFTLCGGHVAPIYDGCLREGIDIIDTRHEQAAVHAADGWARLTRQAGVAILTAGPGVTDGVTGVAAELRFIGKGALQEMEQTSLLRPITKASFTAADPRRLGEYVRTAFRIATSGVPGPVFVELPFDVLCAQVQDPFYPALPRPWPRQPGDPAAVEAAAKLLGAAQKPIVFAGSQIWWDDAAGALARFAERTGIPVFTNAMGRGALPPEHPLAFNMARKKALRSADVVLVVGTPLDFRVGYGAAITAQAKIVQIDRDPTKVAQNRDAEIALLGDARSILDQLVEATPARRLDAWAGELRAEENKQAAGIAAHAASNDRPINHYRLAKAIADAIDDDTILIGDGGDCVAMAARILAPKKPGHWLDPGPLGCLGVGAPFALAAKKLYPDKKVLVLSGDGSFGLNGFDFETAVRFKLPVTVVVANDAAWGQIRGPQVMIFGAERAPATKLAPTRYDKIVEGMGGRGHHVEDPAQLTPTIRAALESGEVSCVNVPIDPEFVMKIGAAKLSV